MTPASATELLNATVYPALDTHAKVTREHIAYVAENGRAQAEERLHILFGAMVAKMEALDKYKQLWWKALEEKNQPVIDVLCAASQEIETRMNVITELNEQLPS